MKTLVSVLRRLLDEADATQSYALHQELAEKSHESRSLA